MPDIYNDSIDNDDLKSPSDSRNEMISEAVKAAEPATRKLPKVESKLRTDKRLERLKDKDGNFSWNAKDNEGIYVASDNELQDVITDLKNKSIDTKAIEEALKAREKDWSAKNPDGAYRHSFDQLAKIRNQLRQAGQDTSDIQKEINNRPEGQAQIAKNRGQSTPPKSAEQKSLVQLQKEAAAKVDTKKAESETAPKSYTDETGQVHVIGENTYSNPYAKATAEAEKPTAEKEKPTKTFTDETGQEVEVPVEGTKSDLGIVEYPIKAVDKLIEGATKVLPEVFGSPEEYENLKKRLKDTIDNPNLSALEKAKAISQQLKLDEQRRALKNKEDDEKLLRVYEPGKGLISITAKDYRQAVEANQKLLDQGLGGTVVGIGNDSVKLPEDKEEADKTIAILKEVYPEGFETTDEKGKKVFQIAEPTGTKAPLPIAGISKGIPEKKSKPAGTKLTDEEYDKAAQQAEKLAAQLASEMLSNDATDVDDATLAKTYVELLKENPKQALKLKKPDGSHYLSDDDLLDMIDEHKDTNPEFAKMVQEEYDSRDNPLKDTRAEKAALGKKKEALDDMLDKAQLTRENLEEEWDRLLAKYNKELGRYNEAADLSRFLPRFAIQHYLEGNFGERKSPKALGTLGFFLLDKIGKAMVNASLVARGSAPTETTILEEYNKKMMDAAIKRDDNTRTKVIEGKINRTLSTSEDLRKAGYDTEITLGNDLISKYLQKHADQIDEQVYLKLRKQAADWYDTLTDDEKMNLNRLHLAMSTNPNDQMMSIMQYQAAMYEAKVAETEAAKQKAEFESKEYAAKALVVGQMTKLQVERAEADIEYLKKQGLILDAQAADAWVIYNQHKKELDAFDSRERRAKLLDYVNAGTSVVDSVGNLKKLF